MVQGETDSVLSIGVKEVSETSNTNADFQSPVESKNVTQAWYNIFCIDI